jgi:hypothetical protein
MKAILALGILLVLLVVAQAQQSDPLTNLNNADLNTQLNAIANLGSPGNHQAVEPLLKRLNIEKNGQARAAIIRALGRIGDQKAAPPLRDLLTKNTGQSTEIIEALVALKDDSSVPLLRKLFWRPSRSADAANALFMLGDGKYVVEANRWRRSLAIWVPIAFLLLLAVLAAAFSHDRNREFFRISLAAANAALGLMLGFSLCFAGYLLTAFARTKHGSPAEWSGIAILSVAILHGFYSGFFSALAPFLQIRNWRSVTNAFALALAALILSPLAILSMSKVFTQRNDPVVSPLAEIVTALSPGSPAALTFVTGLVMASLAVLTTGLVVSIPLRGVRCEPAFSGRQFVLIVLVLGAVFLLHDPLAQCIVAGLRTGL